MDKPYLKYNAHSDTIRQMPQNYLIAQRSFEGGAWICDPDSAADQNLAVKVFLSLFEFKNKYERDGNALAERIQPYVNPFV